MHYLSAEGLSKDYGERKLFTNLNFHINQGEKIALVAKNGSGKTSLIKIIAGLDIADAGKLTINKDVKIAFFEQEPVFNETQTVIENIFHINHPILNLIKEYEDALANNQQNLMPTLLLQMDELGAWQFEAKVKEILSRLRINNFKDTVKNLSGGQRKRIALARTLIDIGFEPGHFLLLMDEPTNHLDVQMVEWLENYINKERLTLLMVTHDRYFLDEVCDTIWEMENQKLFVHRGNYAYFLEKKAQRLEQDEATLNKAQNTYRKELEWMRKQPKARTTKSKSREDNFYEIEKIAKSKIADDKLQLNLQMNRLGGKIAEFKKAYKSFGNKVILKGFDYTFKKGERIGIVGNNGTGKTTFINLLQQLEQLDSGKINIGDTVTFGYFSQHGLVFKTDMRMIDYVKTFAEFFPLAKGGSISAAQFLQLFLFTPEQQFTYISKLSGGEKKRLLLLTVLFKNPNFLILDEPTNDLDLPTLSVLENFLLEYQGCVILISHDRYFMDRLVDHLMVFEGEGNIKEFPGNYSQYRVWQEQNKKQEKELQETAQVKPAYTETASTNAKRKLSFKEKHELENIEKQLPILEEKKNKLAIKLQEANLPYEEIQTISEELTSVTTELEEKEMRWLDLSEGV
jgi:ABC transport system ATP-binding/permease protein